MKRAFVCLLSGMLVGAAVGFWYGRRGGAGVVTVTRVRVDTVRYASPPELVVLGRREVRRRLPMACDSAAVTDSAVSADSAEVLVPYATKVYGDTAWRAYVSGYDARLDSLVFVQRHVFRAGVPAKQRRWSVGVQAGYGLTPAGCQPYIGIGVSLRLL